VKDNFKKLLLE